MSECVCVCVCVEAVACDVHATSLPQRCALAHGGEATIALAKEGAKRERERGDAHESPSARRRAGGRHSLTRPTVPKKPERERRERERERVVDIMIASCKNMVPVNII